MRYDKADRVYMIRNTEWTQPANGLQDGLDYINVQTFMPSPGLMQATVAVGIINVGLSLRTPCNQISYSMSYVPKTVAFDIGVDRRDCSDSIRCCIVWKLRGALDRLRIFLSALVAHNMRLILFAVGPASSTWLYYVQGEISLACVTVYIFLT